MKRTILLSLLLWVAANTLSAQPTFAPGHDPKPDGQQWVPVDYLSDEFNGSTPDTDKWQIEPIGNDWGWDGRPPALFRAENVRVGDGKLQVTVGKLDKPVYKKDKTFTHQGGIVRSLQPGNVGMYFEAKMKANATVMSSTFWLMTKYDCEKKLETDIQECVGRTTELTAPWANGWDSIFHSNAIHRPTACVEKLQLQNATKMGRPNHADYHIYAAWWKSPEELQFFLDGEHQYTINPKVEWDMPAFIHMAIETYDWNPIPEDGGLVESGTREQRTTQYEWVRTWQLAPAATTHKTTSVLRPKNVQLLAHKTELPVTIDGKPDDAAWQQAEVHSFDHFYRYDFPSDQQKTTFRMLWDEEKLYFLFECEDAFITARETQRDGQPYDDDCAEIFLIPAAQKIDMHFGFEVNLYKTANDFVFLNDMYKKERVVVKSYSPDYEVGVQVNGTMNDNSDKDEGWSMEMAIPHDVFHTVGSLHPIEAGTKWAFLALRQDRNDATGVRRTTSTIAPLRKDENVHNPRSFWVLQFVE